MDADHGHSHGPGGVANRQLQVFVMRPHVLLHQTVLDQQVERIEYLGVELFLLEQLEEGFTVLLTLLLHAELLLAQGRLEVLGVVEEDLFFPRFQHLLAPDEDHAAFLVGGVALALGLELAKIPKQLLILFLNLDQGVERPVPNLQVVGALIPADVVVDLIRGVLV